jgi:hypothetical protein
VELHANAARGQSTAQLGRCVLVGLAGRFASEAAKDSVIKSVNGDRHLVDDSFDRVSNPVIEKDSVGVEVNAHFWQALNEFDQFNKIGWWTTADQKRFSARNRKLPEAHGIVEMTNKCFLVREREFPGQLLATILKYAVVALKIAS